MGPRLGRFRLKSFTFFRLATEIGPARSHLVKCHLTKCLTFPRFVNGKPVNIPGHSVPLAGLGGFILVFGFLAFNGGSQVSTLGLTLIATNSCCLQATAAFLIEVEEDIFNTLCSVERKASPYMACSLLYL